jgi:3-deoxy-D-arabino-heptulosonate 7-phosphate (DAHP) synthase class II
MSNSTNVPVFAARLAAQFNDSAVARIQEYVARSRGADRLDDTTVRYFLQDMVNGLNEVNEAIASVSVKLAEADLNFDQAESTAALELFPEYIESRKIKGTADERKFFVQRDKDVLKYKEEKLYWKAVLEYLKGVGRNLEATHTDARTCNKPSNIPIPPILGGSLSSPYGNSGSNSGMVGGGLGEIID